MTNFAMKTFDDDNSFFLGWDEPKTLRGLSIEVSIVHAAIPRMDLDSFRKLDWISFQHSGGQVLNYSIQIRF